MTPPFAVLSCDLDPVDRHLEGYGVGGAPPCDRIYRTAVPRLLELLSELGAPGVLFTVARDAGSERALLRDAVSRGHEIASHSQTHPLPFSTLGDGALADELAGSRSRLSDASGEEVIGFRAPGWDADARVLAAVRAAGYRYDSSVFPTPALLANRLAGWWRSEGRRSLLSMGTLGHTFAPRVPHRMNGSADGLVEFPMAVTRWLRLPVYHTFRYFVPRRLFLRALDSVLRSDTPLSYEFHAADLLDLEGDGVDPRMSRHPGMGLPLDRKRGLLREALARIVAARRVITYRRALEERIAT